MSSRSSRPISPVLPCAGASSEGGVTPAAPPTPSSRPRYDPASALMSYSGAWSASARGGSSATRSSPSKIASTVPPVTSPMRAPWSSHLAKMRSTSASRPGRATTSIRSCDSDSITSCGVIALARRGTRATSMRIPTPLLAATSLAAQVSPAAPRSWTASTASAATSSSVASGGGPHPGGAGGGPEKGAVGSGGGRRALGEAVAEVAAAAGGGALIGLERRRMVVALPLEHAEEPVAEIDRAGVLAGADGDRRPGGGQRAQQALRMLVRAVLAPHRAEHRPLQRIRLAADELAHASRLVLGEADFLWDLVRLRRPCPRHRRGRSHELVDRSRRRHQRKE